MESLGNRLFRTRWLILAVCLAVSVPAQVKQGGNALLAGFDSKIDRGQLSDVDRELFNYVIANPKDARGFSLLGKLRLRQNRPAEAKALLNKALAIDPTLVSAKVNLASVHLELGDLESARSVLGQIAEPEVSDAVTRLAVAVSFASAGDCVRALAWADKLPLKMKNGDAVPFRAGCYLETGERKNFDTLFLGAKTSARRNPAMALKFGEILNKKEMHKEAAILLRMVIVSIPKNLGALLVLAGSEIELKDFANARIHLNLAEKLDPRSSEMLFVRSLLERKEGNNAKSLEFLELSLAGDPDNVKALAAYVIVAIRARQSGKALRAAEKLVAAEPDNPEFLYLFGIAALENGSLQKAEASLTKLLDARPYDSAGCFALGMTLAGQATKLVEARVQMEKCLAMNPKNFEAAYQLGLSYKAEGETAKAIGYLERTIALAPDYSAALRDLGAAYLQAGEEQKARPFLEKSIAIDPNDADAHFQLSRLYNLIGERELGKKHLEIFQKLKNPKKDGM